MKKIIVLCVLLLPSTARGEWPQNYWELPSDQQIEVLMAEGGGEYELDKIGKTAALPILHSLLENYANTDENKTMTVMRMLKYFHDEASVEPLMQALVKNVKLDKEVVETVAIIYWRTKSETAYQAMIKLLKMPRYQDETGDVEKTLYTFLVVRADKPKIPYLLNFLKDKDFPNRYDLIEKIGNIGDPPIVVPRIAEVLLDTDPELRLTVADTLGKIGSSLAISPLKNAIKIEDNLRVKLDIAAQLVKLGEFLYLEENLTVLESSQWADLSDVRSGVIEWLKELTGQDFGDDAAAWRKWFEDEKVKRGLK